MQIFPSSKIGKLSIGAFLLGVVVAFVFYKGRKVTKLEKPYTEVKVEEPFTKDSWDELRQDWITDKSDNLVLLRITCIANIYSGKETEYQEDLQKLRDRLRTLRGNEFNPDKFKQVTHNLFYDIDREKRDEIQIKLGLL